MHNAALAYDIVPDGHFVHSDAPTNGEYVPFLHGVLTLLPYDDTYDPAGDGVHLLDVRAALYVPGLHSKHLTAFVLLPYCPFAQYVHSERTELYPIEQPTHVPVVFDNDENNGEIPVPAKHVGYPPPNAYKYLSADVTYTVPSAPRLIRLDEYG